MNRFHPTLIGLLAPFGALFAQCDFTPTISPDQVILCPEETATLITEPYDAYQWYKDGYPIPGATEQTLVVEQFTDAGSLFAVAATQDGCTAMSASVLVDGYVFLLPYVIHGGDEPINQGPTLQFCEGDTLSLTLSPGYTQHITWFRDGTPIPGEQGPTLYIGTSGAYTVTAAPEVCPNAVMGIGVEVHAEFIPLARPDIVVMGEELCVDPTGLSTQWYFEGEPIATTDCIPIGAEGPYTAFVDYGQACQGLSEPMTIIIDGILPHAVDPPLVAPSPASDEVVVVWPHGAGASLDWLLLDGIGRTVLSGTSLRGRNLTLNVRGLAPGHYSLVVQDHELAPARVIVGH